VSRTHCISLYTETKCQQQRGKKNMICISFENPWLRMDRCKRISCQVAKGTNPSNLMPFSSVCRKHS
jgi:hypothetical protein